MKPEASRARSGGAGRAPPGHLEGRGQRVLLVHAAPRDPDDHVLAESIPRKLKRALRSLG